MVSAEVVRDAARHSAAGQRRSLDNPVTVVVTGTVKHRAQKVDRSLTTERGFVLVRCHDAIGEAIRYCERLAPCVWILDQEDLQKLDPAQFSSAVDFGRSIQVLVWVSSEEPPTTLEPLLRMGCMGFIREVDTTCTLRKAVRAVSSGEYWTSRKLATRLLQRYLAAEGPRRLTKREAEIMQLIAKGYRNREIAEKLLISRETVRWHLRSLYGKVGVQDRLGASISRVRVVAGPEVPAATLLRKPILHQTAPPTPNCRVDRPGNQQAGGST